MYADGGNVVNAASGTIDLKAENTVGIYVANGSGSNLGTINLGAPAPSVCRQTEEQPPTPAVSKSAAPIRSAYMPTGVPWSTAEQSNSAAAMRLF